MKRMINVANKAKALELAEMGFKYTVQDTGSQKIYVFIETDKLREILNGKGKFSKKDYCYSNIMKF